MNERTMLASYDGEDMRIISIIKNNYNYFQHILLVGYLQDSL